LANSQPISFTIGNNAKEENSLAIVEHIGRCVIEKDNFTLAHFDGLELRIEIRSELFSTAEPTCRIIIHVE
jgi:hypothetical protein